MPGTNSIHNRKSTLPAPLGAKIVGPLGTRMILYSTPKEEHYLKANERFVGLDERVASRSDVQSLCCSAKCLYDKCTLRCTMVAGHDDAHENLAVGYTWPAQKASRPSQNASVSEWFQWIDAYCAPSLLSTIPPDSFLVSMCLAAGSYCHIHRGLGGPGSTLIRVRENAPMPFIAALQCWLNERAPMDSIIEVVRKVAVHTPTAIVLCGRTFPCVEFTRTKDKRGRERMSAVISTRDAGVLEDLREWTTGAASPKCIVSSVAYGEEVCVCLGMERTVGEDVIRLRLDREVPTWHAESGTPMEDLHVGFDPALSTVSGSVVYLAPKSGSPVVDYAEKVREFIQEAEKHGALTIPPTMKIDFIHWPPAATPKPEGERRAIDIALEDIPTGCDPSRWKAVVHTIAADLSEPGPVRVRATGHRAGKRAVDYFADDVANVSPVVAAYAQARFVWGYGIQDATREALERCQREDDPALTRYLVAYERG